MAKKATKKKDGTDRVPMEPHFELRKNEKDNKWNWVFWSANHRPIAANLESYGRRNDAMKGIEEFRKNTGCATIYVTK